MTSATTNGVWLIRHGETEWRRSGRHTGLTDLLTEAGRQAAKPLLPVLARESFAPALTSLLKRARETCELAGLGARRISAPGVPVEAFVIPTDEELYIARDTVRVLGASTRVTGQE